MNISIYFCVLLDPDLMLGFRNRKLKTSSNLNQTHMNQEIDKHITQLKSLGFNALEAEVYLYLLKNRAATAYKVGKDLNKPTANVYKSIDSLSDKGAVMIENNKNKICRAVKSDEFLRHYKRSFINKTEELAISLNELEVDDYDENTYTIASIPLVFEKFKNMLEKSKVIAVIDAFPDALDLVIPDILKAIKKGVEVYIQIYKPVDIPGADIAMAKIAKKTLSHWQSQQLNLIIDGEEYLIALMNNKMDKVIQATWSNNYYMACTLHAGRMHEQTIIKLTDKIGSENFVMDVEALLSKQKYFINSNIPGFNKLFNI
jgi:sugar-specific transcriptional regulator TrmB